MEKWSRGSGSNLVCLSCGQRVRKSPPTGCMEQRHMTTWRAYRDWSNAYQKTWIARNPEKHLQYERTSKYGISSEDLQNLLIKQSGKCDICKEVSYIPSHPLDTDHNHQTGAVRGLLCHACNLLVGLVERKGKFLLPQLTAYLADDEEPTEETSGE